MSNANQSDSISDVLQAMQQRNLVYNYNFLNFSNKTRTNPIVYNHPDGWIYKDNGSGGQISYNPNLECCTILTSNGSEEMSFGQQISEFPRWEKTLKGCTVTANAVIGNSNQTKLSVTFQINDGVTSNSSNVLIEPGESKVIEINTVIDQDATFLHIALTSSDSNKMIDVYKVYANIGDVAIETLPCIVEGFIGERKQYMSTENPPATEISLCQPSTELPNTYTRLNSFLNGKFGFGDTKNSLSPDMRGYFSRAWNNGANIDPNAQTRTPLGKGVIKGDNTGTVEQDDFKEHNHELEYYILNAPANNQGQNAQTISTTRQSSTSNTGGAETRPINIAELYTMKWA